MKTNHLLLISLITLFLTANCEEDDCEDLPVTDIQPAFPVLLTQPQNITVEEGTNVTLNCNVKDQGDILLAWYNRAQILSIGQFNFFPSRLRITPYGNSLLIGNVSTYDTGTYKCTVLVSREHKPSVSHNLKVTGSRKPDLLVTEASLPHGPVILSRPQNITVEKGTNITLPCDVKDLGDTSLMWLNGTEILYIGIFRIVPKLQKISLAGNSLLIKDVSIYDSGAYMCKLLVSSEQKPSVLHKLHVKLPRKEDSPVTEAIEAQRPFILTQSQNITVEEGSNVKLHCDVKNSGDTPLMWLNGTEILYVGKYRIVPKLPRISLVGNSLLIENVSIYDIGAYMCKLLVSSEERPSIVHNLNVKL